ncbi:yeats family protein [Hysterangium stoloniferum]|nr:yeats family protein [Hysterangium stoloniferum]
MSDRVRVRGVTIHRPIIYGNIAVAIPEEERKNSKNPDHTFRWTVAVRSPTTAADNSADAVGGADDLSYFIKRVTFKLHDTYPTPNRNLDKPPYEVTETGWGEFEIGIRITFIQESGEKALSLHHHLKLHQWGPDGGPTDPTAPPPPPSPHAVHSWQYDEIVFHEPYQSFLNILTSHLPTPLPNIWKKPVPPLQTHQGTISDADGETPQFTTTMEQDEAKRLDAARNSIMTETDKMRLLLIEKEKELEQLKRQVED